MSTMNEPVFVGAGWLRPGHVRTFGGPVVNGQCRIPFRLRGIPIVHSALIDTGFNDSMVARHLVVSNSIPFSFDDGFETVGIGSQIRKAATAKVIAEFAPRRGTDLVMVEDLLVDDLPPGLDMVIGMTVLAWGVFTLDGPAKRWEWRVDERKMGDTERVPL